MKNDNLLSNIWKYTVLLITNKRVFVAIIAVYYLTVPGVDAIGISYILLAGSIAGFLMEIPSGYISDRIGHKQTIIISRALSVLSSLFFLLANDLSSLILGSVFMALANAFFSGTGSAFMHDTLKSVGKDHEYGKIMGKAKSLGFGIPLIVSSTVPFLVNYSFKLPFAIGFVMDLIGLFMAVLLVKPTVEKTGVEEFGLKNFKKVFAEGRKLGYLKYTVFSGIVGGLLYSINTFRGPYQEAAGVAVMYFGIFFAAGRLLASVLLWNTHHLQKLLNIKQYFFWQTSLFIGIFIFLGLSANPILVVILFALQNGLRWGLTEIEDAYLLPIIKDSNNKATLLSMGAQSEQLMGGLFAPLIGWIIFTVSYQTGMLYFAILLFTLTAPLYYFIFLKKQNPNVTN